MIGDAKIRQRVPLAPPVFSSLLALRAREPVAHALRSWHNDDNDPHHRYEDAISCLMFPNAARRGSFRRA
jgi:hypothetical protein